MGIQGYKKSQAEGKAPNAYNIINEETNDKNIVCTNCGAINDTDSDYCWRCGSVISWTAENQENKEQEEVKSKAEEGTGFESYSRPIYPINDSDNSAFGEIKYSKKNGLSARISTSDWIKVMCLDFLSFIPLIGSLIFLITVLVLAFKNGVAESIKTYFRARLLVSLIVLALAIVACIVFIALAGSSIGNTIDTIRYIG